MLTLAAITNEPSPLQFKRRNREFFSILHGPSPSFQITDGSSSGSGPAIDGSVSVPGRTFPGRLDPWRPLLRANWQKVTSFCLDFVSFFLQMFWAASSVCLIHLLCLPPVFPPSCPSRLSAQRPSTPDLWPCRWPGRQQEETLTCVERDTQLPLRVKTTFRVLQYFTAITTFPF